MLAHERSGNGPPLVLIHGIGSRRQVWDPLIAELARHREVIAIDLPGFGDSALWPPLADPHSSRAATTPDPATPGPTMSGTATPDPATPRLTSGPAAIDGRMAVEGVPGSVGHLADLVAAFLDDLGLDRPELAGNSLGGGIALELGRRGRASAVTAFAPIGFWSPAGRRWCQTVVGGARILSAALAPALPRIFATRAGRAVLGGIFYGHPTRLSPQDCLASARALSRAPGFAAARRASPPRAGLSASGGCRSAPIPALSPASRSRSPGVRATWSCRTAVRPPGPGTSSRPPGTSCCGAAGTCRSPTTPSAAPRY
ncbi:alpha/beta fold hydrolase [Actinoplanes auranticolor]|uniref:AB hydrolase-1 domain-containing protein n=1 Tax=Actinoplanes auranticolor TaxID=47988 RepID=A0A919VL56_9ACTN|nr:alpha/beta fold hydrolase [Actinoplanes auranticolor]GIM70239.1 hypothetical protein Aau02nite_40070 [Actinoplanes auranticolor]